MSGDVQSDLASLKSNNKEKIAYFHRRIIRIQQEIFLSGENVSPKRLIFQYTKAFSNIDKLKSFIAPNMTYLITFLYNNKK